MHGDMSIDLERHAAVSLKVQQQACDRWVHEFNHVRPHEALSMKTPAEIYERSTRPYRGPRPPRYAASLAVRKVDQSGHVNFEQRVLFVGGGFRGYYVGLQRIDENVVRVWFYEVDLGLLDLSEAPAKPTASATVQREQLKALSAKRKSSTRRSGSSSNARHV
jgi:hypothetical protein